MTRALTLLLGMAVVLLAGIGSADQRTSPATVTHLIIRGDEELKWKPLHPGSEIAVASGDPDRPGSPFVMRFRYHGTVRIPPHWHPTDEHITVLSGAFVLGMGKRFDEASSTTLPPGGYAYVRRGVAHYAWSNGDTVLQVHGVGPFTITYVNPADDPGKAPPPK